MGETHASRGAPLISRRRLLVGTAWAGAAAALSACGVVSVAPTLAVPTPLPSGAPVPDASQSPDPSRAADAGGSQAHSADPTLPPDRDTAMRAENALLGDPGWDESRVRSGVQAYLAAASVGPGDPITLRANGSGAVDVEWYRLGWYGGTGGRLLSVDRRVRLVKQPDHGFDPVTGLVEAGWKPVLHTAAPLGVKSGMLLAVLRDASGHAVANVPVILRPDPTDPQRAPVLFVSAASTWQAYNSWGGTDLYTNTTGRHIPATNSRRAAKVSFDRPYELDGGAGYLRRWELQFIRWMERAGRDVEYIADLDLELNPDLAAGRRLIVMAGHPEYWTRPMRERLEAAVASGVNVAFLTANEVYWQMRLEDGPAGPKTRITCYKRPEHDPVHATNPQLTTCRWREPPLNDPEAPLVGQMYGAVVPRVVDWVVAGSSHWLYEGTRLRDGDAITNLVGQEFDSFVPQLANPGTLLLASSPITSERRPMGPNQPVHNATVYTAPSGATVVAAGTFQWSWAIDDYGSRSYHGVQTPIDDRVVRMTHNLFDRLGDGSLRP